MQKKLFGTDGIRGTANRHPMTPEMALAIGKAVAKVFRKRNGHMHKIVIGKDTRLSGYMIETALTSGIVSAGVNVFLVGPLPTPAIAHLTRSMNADAGIVISASHNPAHDNGIKIFDSRGRKLSDSIEQEIENEIFSAEKKENEHGIGKAYRINDAVGRYIEFAKASISNQSLEGLKVVLDCANGAAYKTAPTIISELGANVSVFHNSPNGTNINENCGALYPKVIQEEVKKQKADIGIALDGDADRVIVCDEKGEIVDGDQIMAICAIELKKQKRLPKNTVVATVMSNKGFFDAMKENGIEIITTRVGDRFVLEKMKEHQIALGGEQSGHIVFFDYSTTGDGIITALQLLALIKNSGKKISQLAKCMKKYPQVLVNVKVKERKPIVRIDSVSKKIADAEKILGEQGRVFVRYSGTENICRVMVEGKNQHEIKQIADGIAMQVKKEIGE